MRDEDCRARGKRPSVVVEAAGFGRAARSCFGCQTRVIGMEVCLGVTSWVLKDVYGTFGFV